MNYFPIIQKMIWLGEDLRAYQHVPATKNAGRRHLQAIV